MQARINGIQMAFSDQGVGIPIVFIHGFPMSQAVWRPQVEVLSSSFRVITMDLRGHGKSEASLWNYTLETYADDVLALLDHLRIEQAVMVGLSMGGYILFPFHRKYSNRVKALVLADTRATADTPIVREGRFKMAQTVYGEGLDPIADAMIPKLLSAASVQGNAGLVKEVRDLITRNPPAGILVDLMAMAERPDSVDLLPNILCPTMVLVGEHDVATPPPEVKEMAGRIKKAVFKVIPGAGHLSNLENPTSFSQAILDFVSSLDA